VAVELSEPIYLLVQKYAAANKQLPNEWILMALRERQDAEVSALQQSVTRMIVRMRIPREALVKYGGCAAERQMILKHWLSAVVTFAVNEIANGPLVAPEPVAQEGGA
jgi:hypothetical protein